MRGKGKKRKGRWRNRLANGLILLALSLYWVPGIWGDAAPAQGQVLLLEEQHRRFPPAAVRSFDL